MKNPSIMATSGRISNEKHVQGTPTVDKMYPTLQVCRTAFDLSPMFSHRHWVPARGMHFQTIRINDIIWWHTSFENPWLTTFGHLAAKVPMHNFHTALYIYIKIYRYTIYRYRYIMHRCTMYIYICVCVLYISSVCWTSICICHKTRAPVTWLNTCLKFWMKHLRTTHPKNINIWCIIIPFTHVHVTCVVSPNSLIYPTIEYRFMHFHHIATMS